MKWKVADIYQVISMENVRFKKPGDKSLYELKCIKAWLLKACFVCCRLAQVNLWFKPRSFYLGFKILI